MYELYDKNGNQIGYRMTKRIKNEDGKYDVLTARSKTSEKDCRKKLDDMVKEYYQLRKKGRKEKEWRCLLRNEIKRLCRQLVSP